MSKRKLDDIDNFSETFTDIENALKKQNVNIVEEREPVPYDAINHINTVNCFGCKHFNDTVFNKDKVGPLMMKLHRIYTTSRLNLPTKVIAFQMKKYFDDKIKPVKPDATWTIEEIEEHIEKHIYFPSAEIFEQLTALKNIKLVLQNMVCERDSNGRIFVNTNNVKLLLMICKQILVLMDKKKNIADMIGYNPHFKF